MKQVRATVSIVLGWRDFFYVQHSDASINSEHTETNAGLERKSSYTFVHAKKRNEIGCVAILFIFPLFATAFTCAQIPLHSCQRFIDIKAIDVVSPFHL